MVWTTLFDNIAITEYAVAIMCKKTPHKNAQDIMQQVVYYK